MAEGVYEPLAQYRDTFRGVFSVRTRKAFEELQRKSGVDVAANRVLVARIHELEKEAAATRDRSSGYGCGFAVACFAAVAAGVGLYIQDCFATKIWPYCLGTLALAVPLAVWLRKRHAAAKARLAKLEALVGARMREAWGQMAPLNRLYAWNIPQRLVEATVPHVSFDLYFTARRLRDLRRLCDWDDAFNEGMSVVCAQSGVVGGNPFVLGDCLERTWGEKSYTGSLGISWLEEEEDAEGRVRMVRRHETLTASVTKPVPVYGRRKFLLYGNDAAPNLSFTRRPDGLSNADDGWLSRWRRHRQLKELEKFSRNLEDDSQFTLMSNHEFETLFQTRDRNHEVEYRLLFTALAQRQMLQLMKDREVGFGDDFTFVKRGKLNLLQSEHLDKAVIDTDPARFRNWDFDAARRTFQSFNEAFFKDVYFALAPILAIPLYQQTRPHADVWKGVGTEDRPSFWELEAIANRYGQEHFRPLSCATDCLLRTEVLEEASGTMRVAVTAHGYRIEKRVDYETVFGGDGRFHEVPVEWDDYIPVKQTSEMSVSPSPSGKWDISA